MQKRKPNDDKIKEVTEKLEQGIKELFESEKYRHYLKVMSKFHQYSFQNSLLISLQCPNATRVAGYTTWKRDFHRQVKRGERGIRIMAPAPYKLRKDIEKIDPKTNKPELGEDGEPIKIRKEVLVPAYKIANVFDISQTDGEPLPEIATELKGTVENYKALWKSIEKVSPVPIKFKEIEGATKGYYNWGEKIIVIRKGMSDEQSIKTAVHELGHAMLHNPDIMKEKKNREQKEVEAESIAFTVCEHYGIDTSEYSFGYIAGWSVGKELNELKESMNLIREVSADIINKIDQKMKIFENDYQLTFYVAEYGEYQEFDNLNDAIDQYQLMKDNNSRELGFIYHDKKDSSLDKTKISLLPNSEMQKKIINGVPEFEDCKAIQKAILTVEASEKKDVTLKRGICQYR